MRHPVLICFSGRDKSRPGGRPARGEPRVGLQEEIRDFAPKAPGAFPVSAGRKAQLKSTTSPVTVKMTRSQMFITRSPTRSRLWATQSRSMHCSIFAGRSITKVSSSR